MRQPVMTERQPADRWQASLKPLRRWRLDNQEPAWHQLFRYVRYHEADVLEFERRSAQHLMTLLGINPEFLGLGLGVGQEFNGVAGVPCTENGYGQRHRKPGN